MKIFSTYTGGRLANQLYFVLQAFCISKKIKQNIKYTQGETIAPQTSLKDLVEILNIHEFYESDCKKVDFMLPVNKYFQDINVDFREEDVEEFISQTIFKSEFFQQIFESKKNSKSVAIHIRNGDYLQIPLYCCFNRKEYIQNAIKIFNNITNEIKIFSDDIDLCKQEYENLFKKLGFNVTYSTNTNPVNDFLELSCYKNKILWNSTFSYWSGFISSYMFRDSIIVCPNNAMTNVSSSRFIKKSWITV